MLNGTVAAAGSQVDQGTVVRGLLLTPRFGPPHLVATTVIASGFPEELNSAALVIGPTGVALGRDDTSLFVADTLDNRIVEIPFPAIRLHSAGVGTPISTGGILNGPLGLATAPDGNLLAVNGATATWWR